MVLKIRKNKKKISFGFSLIELLVTVGIIAVLAAIAIPNYTNYKKNANELEAKNILIAIYSGEKSFQLEHSSYASDFEAVDLQIDGSYKYNAGFKVGDGGAKGEYTGTVTTGNFNLKEYCGNDFGSGAHEDCKCDSDCQSAKSFHTDCKVGAVSDNISNKFTACAATQGVEKYWYINQYRQLDCESKNDKGPGDSAACD